MRVKLNSIERVKWFSALAITFDGELTLISGRYHIDGKSIMGIFSLDLTKPIELEIECDDKLKEKDFISDLKGLNLLEEV